MSDTTSMPDRDDPDSISPDKVVAVTFTDDDKAFEALAVLKQLDSDEMVKLVAAEVVTRNPDGSVEVKDQTGGDSNVGTASGGLIGLLVGIIGGPFGVLIGGATGLLLGSLYDLDDEDTTDSALGEVSKSVQVGHNTLLAQVIEQSPDVVDTAMANLSGTVVRRPVYEIEDEIAGAKEAQREAKKQARKTLREQRQEQGRAKAHEATEELKSKLHRPQKAPAKTS
jgi:uncharacterized membrane protein